MFIDTKDDQSSVPSAKDQRLSRLKFCQPFMIKKCSFDLSLTPHKNWVIKMISANERL